MSGKLFNFLCSQLERKNSRRTIDLSVNLIFRRIHVYQNGHVPIYRFPSVFFYIFSQKEFFMLTNGTTYQTAAGSTVPLNLSHELHRASSKLTCFFAFAILPTLTNPFQYFPVSLPPSSTAIQRLKRNKSHYTIFLFF